MGVSIGIQAASSKAQQRMLDFMGKEYRPHWQVLNLKDAPCYSSPPIHNPSYVSGKTVIGIDFNAAGFERGYAFALTRWMALRVGKTKRKFEDPKADFATPVPYMIYDGSDYWPVLQQPISKVSSSLQWCCVDRYGMKLDRSGYDDFWLDVSPQEFQNAQARAYHRFGIGKDWPWKKPSDEPPNIRMRIRKEQARLLWPEIKKVVAPLRAELKRLDQAWTNHEDS
jgi:hypothetical protein